MSSDNKTNKKSFSLDWLVGGVLTKVGDTFDRLTGRGWNPSSSLATSKLNEKLKFLLDSEIRDLGNEGKFVPHVIKLKIQWNKFSTDSEEDLEKLEHELHAAAIDHINDKLYHTYAPLNIEIKTDYFTEGVRMLASFGKFADEDEDEVAINVTIPKLHRDDLISNNKITVNLNGEIEPPVEPIEDVYFAKFSINDKQKEVELNFSKKKRISVGRFKENDLSINDQSISKVHASLVLNSEKQLLVADTGSTNGTYINEKRIAYGKAFPIENGTKVKFGNVEILFESPEPLIEFEEEPNMSEEFENLPTHAVANLQDDKNVQAELPQTQAVNFDSQLDNANLSEKTPLVNEQVKSTEANLALTEHEIDSAIAEIQPTEASVKPFETKESNYQSKLQSIDDDFTDEDVDEDGFVSESEIEEVEKSKEINIDKTQDWEI